ncbi:MAG: hypothetical protein KDI69_11580, partial [Xanthomonadales bacterium]|nr:hypothetical protein [Xanthomonadales bacterium]
SLVDRLALAPDFGRSQLDTGVLDRTIQDIERRFPGVQARAHEDVEAILEKLAVAAAHKNWTNVTTGDVAVGLYEHLAGQSVSDPTLRNFLDAEAQATTRPPLVAAIAEAYLAGWVEGRARTEATRELILARARHLPPRWAQLFQNCPEILEPKNAPVLLGRRMAEQVDPHAWLTSVGLPAPHGPGLMEAAHAAFLHVVPDPRSTAAVDRLLGWALPLGAPSLDDRRAAGVVDRIVSPWLGTACPEVLRAHCTRRIVDVWGDPRRDRPEFWSLTRTDTRHMLFRWLARSSMEAIFEIVSEAERGKLGERQWLERRRFWTGVYEQGLIDEAWVALGSDAVPIAERLYRQTQDVAFKTYDHQPRRNDTCILLMKIGSQVFVEGSHSFRIHVFPSPSRKTPEFYAGPYDLYDILLPVPHEDARVHLGPWQEWVRDRIAR